jgi:predicted HicB family RNase H-like nuclease
VGNVNIEIPDTLHKELKMAAVLEDKTIKQLVIEILRAKNG